MKLFDTILRKMRIKTTQGIPPFNDKPQWANAIGQTAEGNWHWLERPCNVYSHYSDSYFTDCGKTEFTGFRSLKTWSGRIIPLDANLEFQIKICQEIYELLMPYSRGWMAGHLMNVFKCNHDVIYDSFEILEKMGLIEIQSDHIFPRINDDNLKIINLASIIMCEDNN